MKKNLILIMLAFLMVSCASTPEIVDSNNIATLTDTPAIQFNTSGWSYTNTTNPFLLTPDYLTNAMLGVSRLKPNEAFPDNGPVVPSELNSEVITELLRKKLSGKENLAISSTNINGRPVIVATYISSNKNGIEYAFSLNSHLVHVLLLATPGNYYQQGKLVSEKLVGSINEYVPKT